MQTKTTMPMMPTMPKAAKNRPMHDCACGCGMQTKATWHTGHDGRAKGWAVRVTRGIMKLDEVPANERKGAMIMIDRIKAEAAKEAKAS